METREVLILSSIIFAFLAAIFWLKASVTKIKAGEGKGNLNINGIDVMDTANVQRKWNSAAAICAAISVSFQALGNDLIWNTLLK